MARKESGFNCESANEKGEHSYGCFQINRDYHKHIKIKEAKDIYFASAWTISNLVGHGWLPRTMNGNSNRRAIQRHNGSNDIAWQYALKVVEYSNLFIKTYDL